MATPKTLPRPKRPKRLTRKEKQAETRRRLLGAGERVFLRRGLQGSSVEEIAAEAGFTRGAFYSNFESKDELFVELLHVRVYDRYADLAKEYIAHTAGAYAPQVSVCGIDGDSTKFEAQQVGACLQTMQPPPKSVIIATDDYHTRRALSIFRTELPQYRWTAAATKIDFLFGTPWWKNREWAKTYLTEWQKLMWWELVDRWKK